MELILQTLLGMVGVVLLIAAMSGALSLVEWLRGPQPPMWGEGGAPRK